MSSLSLNVREARFNRGSVGTSSLVAPVPWDDLPPVLDLLTAAAFLGIGRTAAYQLVRAGQWPTPVVRLGRLIKIPTAPLLELLGLPPAAEVGPTASRQRSDSPTNWPLFDR